MSSRQFTAERVCILLGAIVLTATLGLAPAVLGQEAEPLGHTCLDCRTNNCYLNAPSTCDPPTATCNKFNDCGGCECRSTVGLSQNFCDCFDTPTTAEPGDPSIP